MAVALVIAAAVGMLIAGQTALLGSSVERVPPLIAALLVNAGGVLVGLVWAVLWDRGAGITAAAQEVVAGWWWLAAGGIGWLVLAGLAASAARLGVAAALAVVVATQVTGGLVVDARAGAGAPGVRALVGGALVALGVWLLASR